jgi:hypothetical protein
VVSIPLVRRIDPEDTITDRRQHAVLNSLACESFLDVETVSYDGHICVSMKDLRCFRREGGGMRVGAGGCWLKGRAKWGYLYFGGASSTRLAAAGVQCHVLLCLTLCFDLFGATRRRTVPFEPRSRSTSCIPAVH